MDPIFPDIGPQKICLCPFHQGRWGVPYSFFHVYLCLFKNVIPFFLNCTVVILYVNNKPFHVLLFDITCDYVYVTCPYSKNVTLYNMYMLIGHPCDATIIIIYYCVFFREYTRILDHLWEYISLFFFWDIPT